MPAKHPKKRSSREKTSRGSPLFQLQSRDRVTKSLQKAAKDLPLKKIYKSPKKSDTDPKVLLNELMIAIKGGNTDPLVRQMGMYALGDVVSLGLMSQEEFDEDAIYDDDGNKVRLSGRDRALNMIPAKIRAMMMSEITPYFLSRKTTSQANGTGPRPKVTFYVPENGRPVRGEE